MDYLNFQISIYDYSAKSFRLFSYSQLSVTRIYNAPHTHDDVGRMMLIIII